MSVIYTGYAFFSDCNTPGWHVRQEVGNEQYMRQKIQFYKTQNIYFEINFSKTQKEVLFPTGTFHPYLRGIEQRISPNLTSVGAIAQECGQCDFY